ncbi:MAG: FAD binding domain-containing protein [Hyphomicrobiaceae bacterium]
MKPAPFEVCHPDVLRNATEMLETGGQGAKLISGGQSLGPMMNLRLARPSQLVDVSRLAELRDVDERNESVLFGAATTHAEIEDGKTPDPIAGMMRQVARGIAYRVVRNKGTIGGSVAHADPAADWISALTVADAKIHIAGKRSNRTVAMHDFVLGAYTTDLRPDEIITKIEVPKYSKNVRWGYYKICRKVGEFADAIGATIVDPERRYCRVVAGAVGGKPLILVETARQLAQAAAMPVVETIHDEIAASATGLDAASRHQLATAVGRAITEVVGS